MGKIRLARETNNSMHSSETPRIIGELLDMSTDSARSVAVCAFTSYIPVRFLPLEHHAVGVKVQNYAKMLGVIAFKKP